MLAATAGLLLSGVVVAPSAFAANGCQNGNGYRYCRTDVGTDFVSLATYPGVVKAGRPQGITENVWIDSDRANHLAHGNGSTQYRPGPPGAKYRGCSWFVSHPLGNRYVVCTAWVQGY